MSKLDTIMPEVPEKLEEAETDKQHEAMDSVPSSEDSGAENAPGVTEEHVIMLVRSELDKQIEEIRPNLLDEASFAAASGTRDALSAQ